jgi:[ribosomal protein S18]-alanine N-acetyltransferase
MSRPSPWVAIPVAVAGVGGATVGFVVTAASCSPRSCVVPAVAVAVAVGLVASVGVGVVVILALRSLAEFRENAERDILTFVDHPAGEVPDISGERTATTIAEADESLVDAIAAFLQRAWHEAGPGAPGWAGATDEIMADLARPETIRDRLGGPERRLFVALQHDDVIGLAATRHLGDDSAELAGIVVLQSVVESGVGTPLLELAVSSLASDGCRRVIVSTEPDNERALRFYAGRGFTEVDRHTEDVAGTPLEVVRLERRLD